MLPILMAEKEIGNEIFKAMEKSYFTQDTGINSLNPWGNTPKWKETKGISYERQVEVYPENHSNLISDFYCTRVKKQQL